MTELHERNFKFYFFWVIISSVVLHNTGIGQCQVFSGFTLSLISDMMQSSAERYVRFFVFKKHYRVMKCSGMLFPCTDVFRAL